MNFNELFKFPIVMIDGEKEEEKEKENERYALDKKEDPELIFGQAEVPYWDFLSIKDRWLPTEKSYLRALEEGKFDACQIEFDKCGSYMSPIPKEEFKKRLENFITKLPQKELQIFQLSEEQLKNIIDANKSSKGDQ